MASHEFWSLFAMANLLRGGVPLSVTFCSWSRNVNRTFQHIHETRCFTAYGNICSTRAPTLVVPFCKIHSEQSFCVCLFICTYSSFVSTTVPHSVIRKLLTEDHKLRSHSLLNFLSRIYFNLLRAYSDIVLIYSYFMFLS